MLSTSSDSSYPNAINSFDVCIKLLRVAFSSTILIYFSTFAVVGTLSGNSAKYSKPPTLSKLPCSTNSAFTVIISTGSFLEYKLNIAEYIAHIMDIT